MNAIARFSTRRPLAVLLAWLAVAVGLQAASAVWGGELRETYSLPGSDSQAAYDILDEHFPARSGDTDTVVVSVSTGTVTDPAVRAEIDRLAAELLEVPSVASVTGPFDSMGAGQLSATGAIAFLTVTYDKTAYNLPIADVERVREIALSADGAVAGDAELTVGHGGQAASRLSDPEVGPGEMIGIGIAAIILFIAFGSLIATTVPLISAVVALSASLGILGLISAGMPITNSAPTISVLLGMGVGIDYALFIVNRHRLGLKAGRGVPDSIIAATTTSGRAVVFAGVTVVIALAGMFVPRIAFLSGLAIAAAVTVLVSVAASITLVPALLELYGERILPRRLRERIAREGAVPEAVPEPGRFARLVERRPWITSLAAVAVLAVLAVPALDLRLGSADQGNDPQGEPTRVAYDLIAQGFGDGANGPLVIVFGRGTGAPFNPAAPDSTLLAYIDQIAQDEDVVAVMGPLISADGGAAVVQAIPVGSPQDESTVALVERIRGDYLKEAPADGLDAHVGGSVASSIDFTDALADSLPGFFAIVVGLSVLVLTVAFRSLTLPLVGAAMNLLSAAASFGIIVAVFQWGWGNELVGVGEGGPIDPFAPLILFALLFGLSMDYQVFLVSRVAELWHATGDNALAVRRGLAEVSRVIIAAASIMVVVFGSFVTSDSRVLKLLGLGLAAAIFIDAFVVRVVLIPAFMRMLGRANWWMPAWLDRILPHLEIDGEHRPLPTDEQTPDRALTPA